MGLWSPNRLQYICGVKSLWQVGIRKKTSKKAGWRESMTRAENRFTNTAV